MGTEGAHAALPDDVLQSLRVAFAGEVAARLPRLRTPLEPATARQDAHTLASSAWVVGERGVSVLARAVEDQLIAGGPATDLPALVAALEKLG